MVDTSLAAFRLLELIALLFPVVALLVQLQQRVAESTELEILGLASGMSLLLLLSVSFLHLSFYLISIQPLPMLLTVPLLAMSLLSLLLPLLIALSTERFVNRTKNAFSKVSGKIIALQRGRLLEASITRPDEADGDEE